MPPIAAAHHHLAIGPALAGLLVETVGFGWTFFIDGVSYLAVLAALLTMRRSELHPAVPAPRSKGQVRAGLRYVKSVPELGIPLVMMAIIGTLAFNFQVVLPLFVTRDLRGKAQTFTLLYSVLSAGSFVGVMAVPPKASFLKQTLCLRIVRCAGGRLAARAAHAHAASERPAAADANDVHAARTLAPRAPATKLARSRSACSCSEIGRATRLNSSHRT